MKDNLKKIVRVMAGWPLIGRLIRIGVAVIRLPDFRVACMDYHCRQHIFETEQLPVMVQTLARQHTFETEQLPTLLKSLSGLNSRQLESDKNIKHLMASVPVALRELTREQIIFKTQLKDLSALLDSGDNEKKKDLTEQQLENNENLQHSLVSDIALKEIAREQIIFREELSAVLAVLTDDTNDTEEQCRNIAVSISYLMDRLEFIRRELMFEMRYGVVTLSGNEKQLAVKKEILFPEKLADARKDRLRLNLGCGHLSLEGYLNVDRRALPGVDIVAEVDDIPLGQGEVDEIYSAHLLEHFPQEQLRRELLPYFLNLLKSCGEFRAIVPDGEAMMREYSKGLYAYDDMREVIYGAQDYDGDFHFNMFTPDSLTTLLQDTGFVSVKVVESSRRNGKCYEFEIIAFKSGNGG